MVYDKSQTGKKDYIGYEYREITADMERVSFLLDGYENFGWEQDENLTAVASEPKKIVLHLKRNRKIMNKTELTRLQRNFESCIKEIAAMENAKTSAATAYAVLAGVIGTAFMAGSVFAVTSDVPHVALCVLFAIPGIVGWIIPYFLYRRIAEKQEQKLTPLIEAKYNEIYEICEKGHNLLN